MNYQLSLISRLLIPFIISYSLLEKVFFFLTIHTSYYLLNLIKIKTILISPYLITFSNYIRFSSACAIISAYFFLLLLIILTKDISFKKRIKMFLLGSLMMFLINIARIIVLILILERNGFNAFQQAHDIIWMIMGSVLVALIWIFLIKVYHVKSIPIYSDIKYLLN